MIKSKNWLKEIKESEIIELKPSLSQINDIVETISAFANTAGGKIVIGVSNSGKILGVEIGKGTIENLTNKIRQEIDPKIHPRITIKQSGGNSLIIIEVKESPDHLVLAFGRPFKRVGRSSVKMSKDEYEQSILEKHKDKLQFDKQICNEAEFRDIDTTKIKWFLSEAKKQRGLKISGDTKPKDILRHLGLLRNNDLTNAAMLLFSKEPKFIQSEIKCIRFKGNKAVKPYIDFQTLNGNLFDLVDQALDFILRNIKKAIWLVPEKVQREEKYEYPPDALREAIVNAVVHRDYFSPSKVQIRVFDDYIEIWNPGELPKGWAVEKLKQKHESIPRNPLLFKQFFWVKYVEDVGGGTLDMVQECKKWGLAEPDFEYTGTSLIVTLKKSKLTEDHLASLGLNERQKRAIEYLKKSGRITNGEYQGINKTTKKTASRDLQNVVKMDVVLKKGRTGKGVFYILNPDYKGT